MESFFVIGGFCSRRKIDTQRIIDFFKANGLKRSNDPSKADVLVVYTCGSFDKCERDSIYTIKKLKKKKKKESLLIVTGCLVKINPEALKKIRKIEIIPFEQFDQSIHFQNFTTPLSSISEANDSKDTLPYLEPSLLEHIYIYIKEDPFNYHRLKYFFNWKINEKSYKNNIIFKKNDYNILTSRGCLNNCSYCAIKKAQGNLQSRPQEDILRDINIALKQGYKRIVLSGEDTGAYGKDKKSTIIDLLSKILEIQGNYTIALSDFNPRWFVNYFDELLPLFKKHQNKISDLQLPIQSASNKILKLMRRSYDINELDNSLSIFEEEIPQLKIHTHVIVGFPSEKEADFKKSYEFIKNHDFYTVIPFCYQDRSMVDSATFKNKIKRNTIYKRMIEIRTIQ